MQKHATCLICNSDKLQKLKGYYEKKGLIKCKPCGFVFMEQIPSLEELEKYYSTYSYGADTYYSPITAKSYNLLLDEFEKYRQSNKILDIGCGQGWFLMEAKKRGWEVYGTEFSQTAVTLCEKKGINMKSGKLNPQDFGFNDFDIITSFEVIEHINDPSDELTGIHSLLRKNGLFYCTTPNFNSFNRFYSSTDYNVIVYPEHLSYYTRNTLNGLARRHGFKNIKFLSTGISITRIKASKNVSSEKRIDNKSSDERLRQNIESKWYLSITKSAVNKLLTMFNLGMTLKGYYMKQ